MRPLFATLVAGISLSLATAVFAQSTPQPAPATPNPAVTAPAPVNPAAPPVASKRFACRTASQTMGGQEGKDQMQVCMAQARLDCLKQAIDQRIVGPQRKEFVKNCVQ
jgi:hypothetical protein